MLALLASVDNAQIVYFIAMCVFILLAIVALVAKGEQAIVQCITMIGFALISAGLWQSITT